MPSFTKDKAGKLKLNEQTESPDQAVEQAKQIAANAIPPAPAAEPEKK